MSKIEWKPGTFLYPIPVVMVSCGTMFIGEVLAIHASEEYFDEKGAFDIQKCHLIAYANGGYYELGKKLGKFGFSVQKKKRKISKNH